MNHTGLPHYVIGTAGHIDHGKTTLTQALTGVDTDRLKEEKERSISIELGFAPLLLPGGQQVSIVDVPGHERFIRHMVSGVGGMDLVLLVIAADEGIMPQTREHVQIVELLGVQHGIIVISKVDLVDEELLELVCDDVREHLQETLFADAPIQPVSSVTGEGIEELKHLIAQELKKVTPRPVTGYTFHPLDRVFTLKGIGTVVTGTIYSGAVSVGDELELMPKRKKVRVRSIQVHGHPVKRAVAGQRAALNITGVELEEVQRGDTLVTPGQWEPTERLDIELHYLKDLDFAMKQNSPVKLHIGTSEVMARLILFDRKTIQPGDRVLCQLALEEPIVASRKQRFILRRSTPAITIGGGWVLDPHPPRHKHRIETIRLLEQKSKGSTPELVLQQLDILHIATSDELSRQLQIPQPELEGPLHQLLESGRIQGLVSDDETFFVTTQHLTVLEKELRAYLEQYHNTYPLRSGAPKMETVQKLLPKWKQKAIQAFLQEMENRQLIETQGQLIRLFAFRPQLTPTLQSAVKQLLERLRDQGLMPEDWDKLCQELHVPSSLKEELRNYLEETGELIKMNEKFSMHREAYQSATRQLIQTYAGGAAFTVQDIKELFPLSRKYLIPLLEKWDDQKITLQQSDKTRVVHPSHRP